MVKSAESKSVTARPLSDPTTPAAADFGIPLETPPMEAVTATAIPRANGSWQYEPKWDGFRCLAFKSGTAVELRAKSGKPLARYFPEVVARLAGLGPARFVVDGELVIEREGQFSFDALQMRLHPAASRVRKLAAETPATLIVFDLLVGPQGDNLMPAPLRRRRAALEALIGDIGETAGLVLSPASRDPGVAETWLEHTSQGALDGVVAKRLDDPYTPGERRMVKVKRQRTADCVVGGFRYLQSRREVGSLLLGLYDDAGLLHHVGFTATIRDPERAALTHRLEALREPPGFTGDAPGGPSRWSTERSGDWQPLRPELVVEVRFDQVTGNRFRHGTTLVRWRPDKAPRQCTFDQLAAPAAPPSV